MASIEIVLVNILQRLSQNWSSAMFFHPYSCNDKTKFRKLIEQQPVLA